MRIIRERILKISDIIKELGSDTILKIEEEDPQYLSISRLRESKGMGNALVLSILIALVSYRLSMRGENWWACFSEYFSSRSLEHPNIVVNEAINFLNYCKGARVQRDVKKRRILKVWNGCKLIFEKLLMSPESFVRVYKDLLLCESKMLSQKPNAKTLVFSIKMGYYAVRHMISLPARQIDIDIPVDIRVACLTYSSGMIKSHSFRDLLRRPEDTRSVWREVSRNSKIPLIHLDALVWRIGGIPQNKNLLKAREEIFNFLKPYVGYKKAQHASEEFIFKNCR